MATKGRPPSAKTLVDRQLGRNIIPTVLPAGADFIIPNHSGDHSEGRVDSTPVDDLDIPNKKYVDDLTTDHPHQDVKTTASPNFVAVNFGFGATTKLETIKGGPNDFTNIDASETINLNFISATNIFFKVDTSKSLVWDGIALSPNADNTFDLGITTSKWKDLYLGGNANVGTLTITDPEVDWKFLKTTINTTTNNQLGLQSQTSGADTRFGFFTKDGDGTDNNQVHIYGVGLPTDLSGSHRLTMGWFKGDSHYKIEFTEDLDFSTSGGIGMSISGSTGNVTVSKDFTSNSLSTLFNTNISSGDLTFTGDNGGLPFAEIYAKDNSTTMTLNSAAKVQVTIFDTNGVSNNTTPDHTNDHITILKAGIYRCEVNISVGNNAGAAHKITAEVYKNNGATLFANLHGDRNLSAGTDFGNMTIGGLIEVAVNDTIEVWMNTGRGSDSIVTVEDINMNLFQIGSTID